MTCDSYHLKLNAWIDGELPIEEVRELKVHLASCEACKKLEGELRSLHQSLTSKLEPMCERASDLVTSTLQVLAQKPIVIQRPSVLRTGWVAIGAAAAGFLFAWLLLQRPTVGVKLNEGVMTQLEQPQLQLTIASGAVEAQKPSGEWAAIPTGGYISCGVPVRTPKQSRCEFKTPEGSEIRLNHETEVNFTTPRQFQVAKGQVWSTVAKDPAPFIVQAADTKVTALGTQFDIALTQGTARLHVLEGSTEVERGGQKTKVESGQYWGIEGDREVCQERDSYHLLQATNWVHEILLLKGRDHPELLRRINSIMASIGKTKMDFLAEEEIRVLGDHAVVPLIRFVQATKADERVRRHKAARLLSDLAQPRSIGEMITLLTDEDPVVRASIAAGLKRITGQELGYSTNAWSTSSPASCQSMQQTWQSWWASNKYRCP
jgi:hypothetical protein